MQIRSNIFRHWRSRGRSALVLAVCAASLLAACSSTDDADADGKDQVTLQLQIPENGAFAPLWYGQAQGIYAKHGIDLEILPGSSSQAASDAVARGTVDFTTTGFPVVAMNQQAGNDIVGVAELVRDGNQGLLVGADSGIDSWKDLPGKSVIITTGSSQKPLFDAALNAAGVDPSTVKIINVNQSVINQTFANGGADAVLTLFPFSEPLVAPKRDVRTLTFAEAGVGMPGFFVVTSRSYVSENSELTTRFVQATLESYADAYRNQDEAVTATLAKNPTLVESDTAAVFKSFASAGCGVIDNGTWFGDFTAKELEDGANTMVSGGLIEKGSVDLAEAFPRATLDAIPAEARIDCADVRAES